MKWAIFGGNIAKWFDGLNRNTHKKSSLWSCNCAARQWSIVFQRLFWSLSTEYIGEWVNHETMICRRLYIILIWFLIPHSQNVFNYFLSYNMEASVHPNIQMSLRVIVWTVFEEPFENIVTLNNMKLQSFTT